MSRPLSIGLTGGIASGKTTVADLFAALGVPIIDSDQVARDVVAPGTAALQQIVEAFGSSVLKSDGSLDRPRMRERIFSDPIQRKRLESILHPAIRTEMAARASRAGGPYQISVVPLLVENGLAPTFDTVVVVDCPEADQLKRLQVRDSIDLRQAQLMLDAQATRAQRLAAADDIVVNSGTLNDLSRQVQRLHEKYLAAAEAMSDER